MYLGGGGGVSGVVPEFIYKPVPVAALNLVPSARLALELRPEGHEAAEVISPPLAPNATSGTELKPRVQVGRDLKPKADAAGEE